MIPIVILELPQQSTPSVGIGTTNPAYKLDVEGDINSRTEVRVAGVGVATGVFIQNNGTPFWNRYYLKLQ